MRLRAQTDANQKEIVTGLRAVGFAVHDMARMGEGFPDLIVSSPTEIWLMEVKGEASLKRYPRTNGLNPRQQKFHQEWKGKSILIVTSLRDAYDQLGYRDSNSNDPK